MKLDVKNLVNSDLGTSESMTIELYQEKIDDDLIAERINGQFKITRLEDEILAHFSGQAKVLTTCDRCAADFELNLPLNFSQEYLISGQPQEEEVLTVSKQYEIDLSEPFRQEIIAAMPVKKVCRPDCAGLCPHCGADLNVKKCKCKEN